LERISDDYQGLQLLHALLPRGGWAVFIVPVALWFNRQKSWAFPALFEGIPETASGLDRVSTKSSSVTAEIVMPAQRGALE